MEKQQAFQRLKHPCVRLLQVTAQLSAGPSARQELIQALSDLLRVLPSIASKPGLLDTKLAEYAFVPISQVLRISRQAPIRALELCLECISVLLRAGWGQGLEPALSGQLLILFTFLAKPASAQNGLPATSEELQALALQCLTDLFSQASRTVPGQFSITATANIPALGEAVLVILNCLTDSGSTEVKLQAVSALTSLGETLNDDDALASFLPRIVSSLTKILTPVSNQRPASRVVERSLQFFIAVTVRLLSDRNTKNLPQEEVAKKDGDDITVSRTTSWLKATASQYKLALSNIFKLRHHDKAEVQRALLDLCLDIVRDCRSSLSDSIGMAVDTMITLTGHEAFGSTAQTEIKMLLSSDEALCDLLLESLHGWIMSLPRMMQSKDDRGRRRLIHQISVTLSLCNERALTLSDSLAANLRDAVASIFAESKGFEELATITSQFNDNGALMLASKDNLIFQPLALRHKGQEELMADFKILLQELSRSESAMTVAQDLRVSTETGPNEMRLGSFWIIVTLLKDATTLHPILEDFLDLGGSNPREELLDDIYSLSTSILSRQHDFSYLPWQYPALALEVVALQARRYQSEFRAELSEVLYPVLDYLGSSNSALREHAMTCLNIVAEASGYTSASELVVANVDYIVNAVSLKLAIGDVSPQAPQVLLMMMRLCGPSLLPYLDDLVGSIFETLERYHGYPKLAELLFFVLKGMTEEGVKSSEFLTIKNQPKQRQQDLAVADVVDALRQLKRSAEDRQNTEDAEATHETFPQKPWKEDAAGKGEHEHDDQPDPPPEEKAGPPAPRIFDLLLRISELTQHYLTTTSPSFRTSLLGLLRTTIPALSNHEDSFLPLINTLWPVLLHRLQDPEAYIVSNCLDIIALMCEHAGEFMRTRIEDSWDLLLKVYQATKQQSSRRAGSAKASLVNANIATITSGIKTITMDNDSSLVQRPELYVDAPRRMIWNSLVSLLCAIASNVTVVDERFDEMLNILEPVLNTEDVRQALERSNADAVWLKLYKMELKARQGDTSKTSPNTLGYGSMPQGKQHWKFISV